MSKLSLQLALYGAMCHYKTVYLYSLDIHRLQLSLSNMKVFGKRMEVK